VITIDVVDTIIFRALEALNAERDAEDQIAVSSATPLFGVDAALDSLEFVSLITDVEASLNLDHGLDISLADDRAMARPQSPYATVETLRDYILEIASET
jgi:acyl carrier protein